VELEETVVVGLMQGKQQALGLEKMCVMFVWAVEFPGAAAIVAILSAAAVSVRTAADGTEGLVWEVVVGVDGEEVSVNVLVHYFVCCVSMVLFVFLGCGLNTPAFEFAFVAVVVVKCVAVVAVDATRANVFSLF